MRITNKILGVKGSMLSSKLYVCMYLAQWNQLSWQLYFSTAAF